MTHEIASILGEASSKSAQGICKKMVYLRGGNEESLS